jgi:hypothetical protein
MISTKFQELWPRYISVKTHGTSCIGGEKCKLTMISLIFQVLKIVFRIAMVIKKHRDKKNTAKVAAEVQDDPKLAGDTAKVAGEVVSAVADAEMVRDAEKTLTTTGADIIKESEQILTTTGAEIIKESEKILTTTGADIIKGSEKILAATGRDIVKDSEKLLTVGADIARTSVKLLTGLFD